MQFWRACVNMHDRSQRKPRRREKTTVFVLIISCVPKMFQKWSFDIYIICKFWIWFMSTLPGFECFWFHGWRSYRELTRVKQNMTPSGKTARENEIAEINSESDELPRNRLLFSVKTSDFFSLRRNPEKISEKQPVIENNPEILPPDNPSLRGELHFNTCVIWTNFPEMLATLRRSGIAGFRHVQQFKQWLFILF